MAMMNLIIMIIIVSCLTTAVFLMIMIITIIVFISICFQRRLGMTTKSDHDYRNVMYYKGVQYQLTYCIPSNPNGKRNRDSSFLYEFAIAYFP